MPLAADDGRARIITFILVTVCSDIGGYVAGVLFGRHPMAPKISPKSPGRLRGSVLFCAIAGSACIAFLFDKAVVDRDPARRPGRDVRDDR